MKEISNIWPGWQIEELTGEEAEAIFGSAGEKEVSAGENGYRVEINTGSFSNIVEFYRSNEGDYVALEWKQTDMSKIETVNSILPDGLPFKLGSSLEEVCEGLGAEKEMTQLLLSLNGEEKHYERYSYSEFKKIGDYYACVSKDGTSDAFATTLYLENTETDYTFRFDSEDRLDLISVSYRKNK